MTLKSSSYLLSNFSRVPLTIVLIRGISTMVNGTMLNFGLDALSNKKILKGVYWVLLAWVLKLDGCNM